jgi:2-isopropylmalate synthase
VVQARTDADGGEVSPQDMWTIFQSEYLAAEAPLHLLGVTSTSSRSGSSASAGSSATGHTDTVTASVLSRGRVLEISGEGNGPVSAFVDALSVLGHRVRVLDYHEHALSSGGDALAAAYVECEVGDGEDSDVVWGVGTDANIVTASLRAVTSAVNRQSR